MLFLGLTSGVIAVLIGAWRQMCTVFEAEDPFELPSAWRVPQVRLLTWGLSTALSIFFAFAVTDWIVANGFPGGKLWFGVILVLRWFASNVVAATIMTKSTQHR